jgi:hypothetical protein
VLWTSIGIEPAALRPSVSHRALATYAVDLPLVADGRIAFVQLRATEGRARVTRYIPGEEDLPGTVRFQSGQWNFVWDDVAGTAGRPPWVRFSGQRFLPGDPVCLRQQGAPLLIYRVCPPQQARARGKLR